MAKRGGGRRARGKEEFEVEEAPDGPEAPAAGIETGLVFATFAALVLALILLWQKANADYGVGPFG